MSKEGSFIVKFVENRGQKKEYSVKAYEVNPWLAGNINDDRLPYVCNVGCVMCVYTGHFGATV